MRRTVLSSGWSTSFNMTPMIDVIFLLIIFFLCVSQYQKVESDDTVKLPEASSPDVRQPTPTQESRLIFNVTGGEIQLGGRRVQGAELAELLEKKRLASPAPLEVWIRADRQSEYRMVEPILLACAKSGIWKVAFKVLTPQQAAMEATP